MGRRTILPRQFAVKVTILVWRFLRGAFNGRHRVRVLKCKYTDSSYSLFRRLTQVRTRPLSTTRDHFAGILSSASTRKLQCYESPGCTFVRVCWGEHHGVRLRSARDLNAVLASSIPG
ncbi:hypothetical protein BDZ89DRAFT_1045247 [Hymenopellis radicata]|nr:hypothetical protein BDZ89DRAFT_1045247 [Hymenopellis radicata]